MMLLHYGVTLWPDLLGAQHQSPLVFWSLPLARRYFLFPSFVVCFIRCHFLFIFRVLLYAHLTFLRMCTVSMLFFFLVVVVSHVRRRIESCYGYFTVSLGLCIIVEASRRAHFYAYSQHPFFFSVVETAALVTKAALFSTKPC